MRRRNEKLKKIMVILLVLFLFLIIYFIFFSNKFKLFSPSTDPSLTEEVKTDEDKFKEMIEDQKSRVIYTFDEDLENRRPWSEDDFLQRAGFFAEAFGSYSSHSNFENISNLYSFMSKSMRSWAESYVKDLKDNYESSSDFYSIRSTFIFSEIENFSPQSNSVKTLVTLQRFETSQSEGERVFNQNIEVVYINEGGEWLVDSASWK